MTAGVETEHGGLYCSSFLALLAGAVTATAGAEMVEQILQRSKAMRHVLISMQRCPHKESKAESRIFLHSFVTDLRE